MILMILGASNAQLNAIKRIKKMGYQCLATDYNVNPIGKKYAQFHELASTFDSQATLNIGKKYNINGIMTIGTDQPVLTCSKVAHALHLPSFLTEETAFHVTNKKAMKKIFKENNIPTVAYRILNEEFSEQELAGLKFPVVVKPLDSQGQRGIFVLNNIKEIKNHFQHVLQYSKEKEIMVETYYPNDEITVSGWVHDNKAKVLTIVDRISFKEQDKIGICLSHEFPSKYLKTKQKEIQKITDEIVQAFHIKEGPIYFQMLIGDEGIKVNEIACRIGGAYEDFAIPLLTGVDILKMVIDYSIHNQIDETDAIKLKNYHLENNHHYSSVQLFFAKEGLIYNMTPEELVNEVEGVYHMGYNYKVGDKITKIKNATARAGYAILMGKDHKELVYNKARLYEKMEILDENNQNMIIYDK